MMEAKGAEHQIPELPASPVCGARDRNFARHTRLEPREFDCAGGREGDSKRLRCMSLMW